ETAFGVVGLGQPVLQGEAGQEREVPGPQRGEGLYGQRWVHTLVARCPGVLIEGLKLYPGHRGQLAQPEAHDDLDVGQVSQHLTRCPLAWRVRGFEVER